MHKPSTITTTLVPNLLANSPNYADKKENEKLQLVEKISFFDTLPPKLQNFLGSELCGTLDKIHNFHPGQYCSRYTPH